MPVQLRPSSEALPILYTPLKGVAEAALYCVHRASTFLLRALRARRAPGRSFPFLDKKKKQRLYLKSGRNRHTHADLAGKRAS